MQRSAPFVAVMVPCVMISVPFYNPHVEHSGRYQHGKQSSHDWTGPNFAPPFASQQFLPGCQDWSFQEGGCEDQEDPVENEKEDVDVRKAGVDAKLADAFEQQRSDESSDEDEGDCETMLSALAGSQKSRSGVLKRLRRRGQALKLATTKDGCQVVRKALDVATIEQAAPIVSQLLKDAATLAHSAHGVQLLELLSKSVSGHSAVTVLAQLQQFFPELCRRSIGARLVRQLLEKTGADSARLPDHIVATLLQDVARLATHSNGWQVVMGLLRGSSQAAASATARHILQEAAAYSAHGVAGALVLELVRTPQLAEEVAEAILDSEQPNLLQVATTSHGSAVVMKLLESGVGGDELEIRLVQRRKALARSSFGKRIVDFLDGTGCSSGSRKS